LAQKRLAMKVRIAAVQYPIEFLKRWERFEGKIATLVKEAADEGAELLVFPEYGAMELASLFPKTIYSDLQKQLEALQGVYDKYLALFEMQARAHGRHILASSFPVRDAQGLYRNRASLFGPDGPLGYQDKLQMTRFENERWGISPGLNQRVFETQFGRLGVAVCYDVEFPLLCRRLIDAGAEIILAPSCTDGLAGYHRVRTGCLARALENQCFVIQSPTVGDAAWSEAVDVNVGAAAAYAPMDVGFPADGVIACGELNTPQWVYADLDLEQLRQVRRDGQVLNHRDWSRQLELLKQEAP
jgi:predicted amidohydrolase